MFSRKFTVCALLIAGVALAAFGLVPQPGGTTPAAAQGDAAVRVIAVPGVLLNAALLPDASRLAVFEVGMIHENQVVPDYLPIKLIDLDSGAVADLTGHTDYAGGAAFSPDGSRLVSYHANGEILVWDLDEGSIAQRFTAPYGARPAFWLPDREAALTITGANHPQMAVFDMQTGAITQLLQPSYETYAAFVETMSSGVPDNISALDVMPDGSAVIAATFYNNFDRWDLVTGERARLVESAEERPMLDYRYLSISADGATFATYNLRDKAAIRFDVQTGAELARLADLPTDAMPGYSADGERVAYVDNVTGEVVIVGWDGAEYARVPLPADELSPDLQLRALVPDLFFSADGARLVLTGFVAMDTGANAVVVIDLEP